MPTKKKPEATRSHFQTSFPNALDKEIEGLNQLLESSCTNALKDTQLTIDNLASRLRPTTSFLM